MENYEKAKEIVNNHVLHNLCLTMEKALEEEPELLCEAHNYEKVKEEINAGNEDRDNWEEPEIYEFWAVSEWLYDRLREEGEITFEYLDFWVWGRQATGQAIYLDKVIQDIVNEC